MNYALRDLAWATSVDVSIASAKGIQTVGETGRRFSRGSEGWSDAAITGDFLAFGHTGVIVVTANASRGDAFEVVWRYINLDHAVPRQNIRKELPASPERFTADPEASPGSIDATCSDVWVKVFTAVDAETPELTLRNGDGGIIKDWRDTPVQGVRVTFARNNAPLVGAPVQYTNDLGEARFDNPVLTSCTDVQFYVETRYAEASGGLVKVVNHASQIYAHYDAPVNLNTLPQGAAHPVHLGVFQSAPALMLSHVVNGIHRAPLAHSRLREVHIHWEFGQVYDPHHSGTTGTDCTCYVRLADEIRVRGGNGDWLKHGTILHELGHHYHYVVTSPSSWIGSYGDHDGDGNEDVHFWDSVHGTQESAFGEAWAQFFAGWVQDTPRFSLGSSFDLSNPDLAARHNPGVPCRGALKECAVAATLWDVNEHYLTVPADIMSTLDNLDTQSNPDRETVTWGVFTRVWRQLGFIPGFDTLLGIGESHGLARWGDGGYPTGMAGTYQDAAADSANAFKIEPGVWVNGDISADVHAGGQRCTCTDVDWFKSTLGPRKDITIYLDTKGNALSMTVEGPSGMTTPQPGTDPNNPQIRTLRFKTAWVWGSYKVRVTHDGQAQGIYWLKIDPVIPYLITVPSDVNVGEYYTVEWGVDGNDSFDHAGLHWGTDSDSLKTNPESHTEEALSGVPPQTYYFTNYESVAPKTMYWLAHAHAESPGEDVYSAVKPMKVHPAHATIDSLWVDDLPWEVEASSTQTACWHVRGSGLIRAWLEHGYSLRMGEVYVGAAPMDVCETITIPRYQRDLGLRVHVVSDDEYAEEYDSQQEHVWIHHSFIWRLQLEEFDQTPGINEPAQVVKWRVFGDAFAEYEQLEWEADLVPSQFEPVQSGQSNDAEGLEFSFPVPNGIFWGTNIEIHSTFDSWTRTIDRGAGPTSGGGIELDSVELPSSIEIRWETPQSIQPFIEAFRVYRRQPTIAEELVATLGPGERRFVDSGLPTGGEFEYRIVLESINGDLPSTPWITASPAPEATATTSYSVTSGVAGSSGWHKSPITVSLTSTGPNNGAYAGVDSVEISRDGDVRGSQTYVEEFESTTGWVATSSNPVTAVTIAPGDSAQQAFGSVEGSFLNDPTQATDSKPRISKGLTKTIAGHDLAQVYVKYDTTSTATNPKGKFDLVLYDGTTVAWHADNLEVTKGWNKLAVPVAGVISTTISRIELVLHEARKESIPRSAELQTFTFDGLRFTSASTLQEAEEGVHLWGTTVTGSDSSVQETTHQVYRLDWTAPVSQASYEGIGESNWHRGPVTVSLSASDTMSGLERIAYKIGNTAEQTYSVPFVVSGEGTRIIEFYARDRAGNEENPRGGTAISIDTVAPTTSISLAGVGDGTWYSSDVTATATLSDATSKVAAGYIRVDGGEWYGISPGASGSLPGIIVISGVGAHTVEAYAVDKAGNRGAAVSKSFTIEQSPPVVRTRAPVPGGVATSNVEVVATHDDLGGTPSSGINAAISMFKIERSLTGALGPWSDITSSGSLIRAADKTTWKSTQLGGLTPATYRITGTIYDRAGNNAPIEGGGWTFTVSV